MTVFTVSNKIHNLYEKIQFWKEALEKNGSNDLFCGKIKKKKLTFLELDALERRITPQAWFFRNDEEKILTSI